MKSGKYTFTNLDELSFAQTTKKKSLISYLTMVTYLVSLWMIATDLGYFFFNPYSPYDKSFIPQMVHTSMLTVPDI